MNDLYEVDTLIVKLKQIKKNMPEIKILKANFINQNITITFKDKCKTYSEIIDRLIFCDMSDRLLIQEVNFVNGEITIKILNHSKIKHLTNEEMEFIEKRDLISAIRSIRDRKQIGLMDAKAIVDKAVKKFGKK